MPLRRVAAATRAAVCAALVLSGSTGAVAQSSGEAAPPRVTLAGQASVAVATADRGYFNDSGYAYDLMRTLRLDGSAEIRLGRHVSVLGDVRLYVPMERGDWSAQLFALFARVTPWPGRALTIQAGRIPPVFGAFSRRGYGVDNPLVGLPLGYQYLTSLRTDALPATADDLLAMRGRGWRSWFPVGTAYPDHGTPLIDALRYPDGVEVHAGLGAWDLSAGVTRGSGASPGGEYASAGGRIAGRVAWRPWAGLVLGASASRGGFLSASLLDQLRALGRDSTNNTEGAAGFDLEYSRGYWLLRAESVYVRRTIPALAEPAIAQPLTALAIDVEGRYRLRPGVFLAGRASRLGFSRVRGSAGSLPWDAPVRRLEAGLGYSLRRNAVVKAGYQLNWRDGGVFRRRLGRASLQLLAWF